MGAAATSAVSSGTSAQTEQGKQDSGSPLAYFSDSLLRPSAATPAASAVASNSSGSDSNSTATSTAEAGRIFARGISSGALPPEDTKYLGQMISQRTGMSQQDAEKRVTETYAKAQQTIQDTETKAKEAADKARRAAAYASLWIFVSLLLGAFIASLAATFGGRRRDL